MGRITKQFKIAGKNIQDALTPESNKLISNLKRIRRTGDPTGLRKKRKKIIKKRIKINRKRKRIIKGTKIPRRKRMGPDFGF